MRERLGNQTDPCVKKQGLKLPGEKYKKTIVKNGKINSIQDEPIN